MADPEAYADAEAEIFAEAYEYFLRYSDNFEH